MNLFLSATALLASACSSPGGPAPKADVRQPWNRHGAVSQDDSSGKGAVLCAWHVYAAAAEFGRLCRRGEDRELQREITRSVDRMEAFIVKNSARRPTLAQVRAERAAGLAEIRNAARPPNCASDMGAMYDRLRDKGAAKIRADLDDMLSIPREPVMNPCF